MIKNIEKRIKPILYEIGFIEREIEPIVSIFLEWQKGVREPFNQNLDIQDVNCSSLKESFELLLPLSDFRSKFLFLSTKSNWTAYFDNGYQGSDPASIVSYLAKELRCQGVRAANIPNSTKTPPKIFGGIIFELYGKPNPILNIQRSIALINEGNKKDKWKFEMSGTPLEFEDRSKYSLPIINKRFTSEMLEDYLKALGINCYSDEYYIKNGKVSGKLISIKGSLPPNVKYY